MDRQELEEGARKILLTNLRRGVADWNAKEFSFVVPSLRGYPFQWFWDSCFHAIALTHLDKEQARAELNTLMSGALPSGFIPHIIFWEMDKQPDFLSRNIVGMTSPYYSSTMQPPIIAYAVERVYQATGDEAFKEMALPVLTGFYRWLRENRDPDDDGLIVVIQPEEAGTDCSPKYDEVLGLEELSNQGFIAKLKEVYAAYEPLRGDDRRILAADIFHIEDVLVNSIYAFGLRALVRLLGDAPEAAEFQREADRTLEALLSKCWDAEAGAFFRPVRGGGEAPSDGDYKLPDAANPGRLAPADSRAADPTLGYFSRRFLAALSHPVGPGLQPQVHARQSPGVHLAGAELDQHQLVPVPRPAGPRLWGAGRHHCCQEPPVH